MLFLRKHSSDSLTRIEMGKPKASQPLQKHEPPPHVTNKLNRWHATVEAKKCWHWLSDNFEQVTCYMETWLETYCHTQALITNSCQWTTQMVLRIRPIRKKDDQLKPMLWTVVPNVCSWQKWVLLHLYTGFFAESLVNAFLLSVKDQAQQVWWPQTQKSVNKITKITTQSL